VDEQQIMERTGHRSSEAVRRYKRSSTQQLKQRSDILKTGKKKIMQGKTHLLRLRAIYST